MNDHQIKLERSALYVVATPIGNLQDLSERAIFVLKNVDWIAAEDTRNSRKLVDRIEASKKLIACHEFSQEKEIQYIVNKLCAGDTGAYICDAGSPCISDPGAVLVKKAREEGIKIIPIPGPSALTSILSVSGFLFTTQYFHGFFPRKNNEQDNLLSKIQEQLGVHVFFESPHRILGTLQKMVQIFGKYQMVIGRELTKKFEDIRVDTVEAIYEQESQNKEPRGEYTLAVLVDKVFDKNELNKENANELINDLIKLGASQKVLLAVGKSMGLERKHVYRLGIDKRKK